MLLFARQSLDCDITTERDYTLHKSKDVDSIQNIGTNIFAILQQQTAPLIPAWISNNGMMQAVLESKPRSSDFETSYSRLQLVN